MADRSEDRRQYRHIDAEHRPPIAQTAPAELRDIAIDPQSTGFNNAVLNFATVTGLGVALGTLIGTTIGTIALGVLAAGFGGLLFADALGKQAAN